LRYSEAMSRTHWKMLLSNMIWPGIFANYVASVRRWLIAGFVCWRQRARGEFTEIGVNKIQDKRLRAILWPLSRNRSEQAFPPHIRNLDPPGEPSEVVNLHALTRLPEEPAGRWDKEGTKYHHRKFRLCKRDYRRVKMGWLFLQSLDGPAFPSSGCARHHLQKLSGGRWQTLLRQASHGQIFSPFLTELLSARSS
jgi:hypothetical protein